MPLDQMVLLLLPSQSVLALPRPQLVNGRAVTISSGTAETAVCMPLSAAAHSEPHSPCHLRKLAGALPSA